MTADSYWNPERETRDPATRDTDILRPIQEQLHYVYQELPFYRRHYDAHGFHPAQVHSLITAPTYALHMLETARRLGYEPAASPLRLGSFIGEPGAGIPGKGIRWRDGC